MHPRGLCMLSPEFSLCGEKFKLALYPNGPSEHIPNSSQGKFGIYLQEGSGAAFQMDLRCTVTIGEVTETYNLMREFADTRGSGRASWGKWEDSVSEDDTFCVRVSVERAAAFVVTT